MNENNPPAFPLRPPRLLLVDDQALFAESLATSLRHYAPDIDIIGIAGNGKEAVKMAQELEPDVILMDIKMPVMDGVEAVALIKRENAATKIIMLSTYDEDALVRSALQAGASGYLLKDISPTELIAAIRALSSGVVQISPEIVRKLIEDKYQAPDAKTARGINEGAFEWLSDLTKREREIFTLIVLGYDNEQIGKKFDLAIQTVRNQVSTIYSKLGVKNRFEIIRLANRKNSLGEKNGAGGGVFRT
ncbi:MAG: response regulator transcription factor [Spirochaetaceae bacterium]|jgi:DNA-binding NarL/FixJ family response regulator|nr:response regulator transcription factor [Spirochaetaceae bacterium]